MRPIPIAPFDRVCWTLVWPRLRRRARGRLYPARVSRPPAPTLTQGDWAALAALLSALTTRGLHTPSRAAATSVLAAAAAAPSGRCGNRCENRCGLTGLCWGGWSGLRFAARWPLRLRLWLRRGSCGGVVC